MTKLPGDFCTDHVLQHPPTAQGEFVRFDGEEFYCITDFQRMPPFLMSIVSGSDHWMYVASSGGLTAGRISAENSLFPYETADRLFDCHTYTGPLTLIRWPTADGRYEVWQPFVAAFSGDQPGSRRLFKHVIGDEVVFAEDHPAGQLTFRYSWRTSSQFGFVRAARLVNRGSQPITLDLVDGLRNLMPSCVELSTLQQASCLVDAYKYSEVEPSTQLGVFSLTAKIHDRPAAAEVLQATTVWCHGLDDLCVMLTTDQLEEFCQGGHLQEERLSTGKRGNYLVATKLTLEPGESRTWFQVADVAQDHRQVNRIWNQLRERDQLGDSLQHSMRHDRQDLIRNVARADGLQLTENRVTSVHHFANVLFNNMRGGVFDSNYDLAGRDFEQFVSTRNQEVFRAHQAFLADIAQTCRVTELLTEIRELGDPHLLRIALEYLPLTFGRRHGDPSRPWNRFEIKTHDEAGAPVYNYEGNWRDIFQNWEALCVSFPAFLPSIVAKFVNASTADGFNPYRISRAGIDWEVPEKGNPWSNIGYWGDHQIVYLTKLLESARQHYAEDVCQLLVEDIFCYARVPYRIKPYRQLVEDSQATIDYDWFAAAEVERRVETLGADGRLVVDANDKIYCVNLTEKLLVAALSKLSNFVPDGGIWLNTQRPEWNDANNALVGAGLSMVTVCYLRRYLSLLIDLLRGIADSRVTLSIEVEQWFRQVRQRLHESRRLLDDPLISDTDRRHLLDGLGEAFSQYRLKVYDDGFTGKHTVAVVDVVEFARLAIEFLDHAIRANRRSDRLFHSYNLLELDRTRPTAVVRPLYEMLEGQVAALSSGLLDAVQSTELVSTLFESQLYRLDQGSFLLYPNRQLPSFLKRNRIPAGRVESIGLLHALLEAGDTSLVTHDETGHDHFHCDLQQLELLEERLDRLQEQPALAPLVSRDRTAVIELFEEVFHHREYTGRSGTMFGYEGLGCIYWHMVSKLLLAIQENFFQAVDRQAPDAIVESLGDAYYLVRGGLGADKTPDSFGAFPTDPYSHTPSHAGAQQPGMTGQVKEEILSRRGELGVRVRDGRLHFQPRLLRRREFTSQSDEFAYFDVHGTPRTLPIKPGELAFTVCQVPVRYRLSDGCICLRVVTEGDELLTFEQDGLDATTSQQVFARRGEISWIEVDLPRAAIVRA